METFKQLFCWVYAQWLSKAANEKTDPLVVVMEAAFGSVCKYCFALRALLFGLGLGLVTRLDAWSAPGLVFVITSIALTLGERYWLCPIPPK